MTFRTETIGDCTLYLGDCLEVLPTLGKVDCIVTDPPYGVKRDKGFGGADGFGGTGKAIERRSYADDWDEERPSREHFEALMRVAPNVLVFGGNYFTDLLPAGKHWIVWDKLNTMPTFGDCELIWTNIKRDSVKKVTVEWNGLLGKEDGRFHPTQKPVAVMSRCLQMLPRGCHTILDPFAGSGTTGVACVQLGKAFIGIEREPKYFDVMCRRIDEATRQPRLALPEPEKPVQTDMLKEVG